MSNIQKVRFAPSTGDFFSDLKTQVDAYFERTGKSPKGGLALYVQTAVMFAWLAGSYTLLMFVELNPWLAVVLAISLGLAVAGVGFNVMHDANHGSYSKHQLVNKAMRFSLDLIGGSSHLWRHKHNVLHHTYTNIEGLDTDGDAGMLLRLAPFQKWHWFHRYQHLYVWPLYAAFAIKWWFADDFRELLTGRIGGQKFPRPKAMGLMSTLLGKVLFFSWAFALPLVLHPTWWLVPLWLIASATTGLMLAVVFQLAHCAGEANHYDAASTPLMPMEWAVHQVTSTIDFAHENRLLSWYVGGLNFQVEHHLFAKICHTRYPAISKIVEQVCRKHDVPYFVQPSAFRAFVSNVRYLRELGRRPKGQIRQLSLRP